MKRVGDKYILRIEKVANKPNQESKISVSTQQRASSYDTQYHQSKRESSSAMTTAMMTPDLNINSIHNHGNPDDYK